MVLVEETGGEAQGLAGGHVLVEARVLGQVADPAADLIVFRLDVLAEHLPAATGRPCQAQQQLDGGGLPGAVGPQEAADRVLGNLQVEGFESLDVLIGLAQSLGFDDRRCVFIQNPVHFHFLIKIGIHYVFP